MGLSFCGGLRQNLYYMETLHLIEDFIEKLPGPHALELMASRARSRHFALTDLKPPAGLCAWCGCHPVGAFTPRLRRYCSADCSETAGWNAKPQGPAVRAWLLIYRQQGACARCGVMHADEVDRLVRDIMAHELRLEKEYPGEAWAKASSKASLWRIGNRMGHIVEVDHVVPIHLGGSGVGLQNVQALCVPCHRRKSAEEAGHRGSLKVARKKATVLP